MMFKKLLFTFAAVLFVGQANASGGSTFPNESFEANVHDQSSLQRGAKYFVNYCMGCHSLEYQRYNRTFEDLGIDPEVGEQTLIFTSGKAVDQMHNAMPKAKAAEWFGKAPPDLSLTARAKGGDYIYNYLQGFYLDDSRPLGFNNSVFPGASMPNPLWQLQGLQVPVYETHKECQGEECETTEVLTGFKKQVEGSLNDTEYKTVAYDLSNFLVYASDPSALARASMGPWVLLFLAILTVLFYILKREYWRDVH